MKDTLTILIMLGMSACGRGPDGQTGPQGLPGVNTQPTISVVRFCPKYTPSQFPETGLCINNQVYAILDQSNGYDYLTYVPEGPYRSQATNASCNFTILPNCVIQN